jgi:hypothetical protein
MLARKSYKKARSQLTLLYPPILFHLHCPPLDKHIPLPRPLEDPAVKGLVSLLSDARVVWNQRGILLLIIPVDLRETAQVIMLTLILRRIRHKTS